MPVFEKPFSSLPEGENFNPDSDYAIFYHSSTGEYLCANIFSGSIGGSVNNPTLYCPNCFVYDSNTSTWIHSFTPYYVLELTYWKPIYSTTDLYLDNSLYFSTSANSYGSVISETVSSSTILTTLKNGVLPLLSVVLLAVVGILTFRKAFSFIRSSVKGA